MNKILLIVGGILLSVVIGLSIPIFLKTETEGVKMDHSILYQEVQDQFVKDLEALHAEKLAESGQVNNKPKSTEDDIRTPIGTKDRKTQATDNTLQDKNVTQSDADSNQEIDADEEIEVPLASEKVVKDAWVQEQIDQNRDQINDSELYTGAEIYNQLDTAYLFGLSEGGLTEEEKQQVSDYLNANLSQGEINTAMSLYYEYVNLLN